MSSHAGLSLLFFLVWLGIICWVYLDAKENSTHPAILWTLVVLFSWFLGTILYLLIGRNDTGPDPASDHRAPVDRQYDRGRYRDHSRDDDYERDLERYRREFAPGDDVELDETNDDDDDER